MTAKCSPVELASSRQHSKSTYGINYCGRATFIKIFPLSTKALFLRFYKEFIQKQFCNFCLIFDLPMVRRVKVVLVLTSKKLNFIVYGEAMGIYV